MAKIALWRIAESGPEKLPAGVIDLEKQLEDWIEKDPSLVQNGLKIIGRQVAVEGGRLDLLALDPNGRLVVIEIKPGIIISDTIGQILFYAAAISKMPYEQIEEKVDLFLTKKGESLKTVLEEMGLRESSIRNQDAREILMMIVGAGASDGLINTLKHFANRVQIMLKTFNVYRANEGQMMLAREITDLDEIQGETKEPADKKKISVESLFSLADKSGVGDEFRMLYKAAEKRGLYPRTYPFSIMYTPPKRRYRTLFTVWAERRPNNQLRVYVATDAFAEFFPLTEEEVIKFLGPSGWRNMSKDEVVRFTENLDRFFDSIKEV